MSANPKRLVISAFVLLLIAFSALLAFSSWSYTVTKLAIARSEGVYSSPEQGMRAIADRHYLGMTEFEILYAGPNSFDGSQPHIWYVIAEIRASTRADGSEMGRNGCDAPGSFFLETRDGWVHVPEGAFPELVGFWMKVFGWAGPGQAVPSTDWSSSQSRRFCVSS